MTNNFLVNIGFDPVLIHNYQLQIKILQTNFTEIEIICAFSEIEKQLFATAKKLHIKMITLTYPNSWLQLEKFLQSKNWKKSLITLELDLLKESETQTNTKPLFHKEKNENLNLDSLSISNEFPSQDSLMSLLKEQAEYHSKMYPEYYLPSTKIAWNTEYEMILENYRNKKELVVAATDKNNKCIALLLGTRLKNTVHISEFIVSQSYRNKGIGSYILKEFITTCKHIPFAKIILETWWNQRAKNLYIKYGFKEIGQEMYYSQ